jgi:hypothetical protein
MSRLWYDRMTLYSIYKCVSCQKAQITTAIYSFRCNRCDKNNNINKRDSIYKTTDSEMARRMLIEYNRQLRKVNLQKPDNDNEFRNY